VQANTNSYWAKGDFLATALPPDVRRGFAPPFTLRENWRASQPRVDLVDGSCGGAEPRLTSGGEADISPSQKKVALYN